MPMIDVYSAAGTFQDRRGLARDLAAAVMRWEKVPPLALFEKNTAAFIHDLPEDSISSVAGDSNYVRVQVLTPAGVLDRGKQLGVVSELTDIIAAAAGDPGVAERTWVLITESPEVAWAIGGHANNGQDIAAAARREMESNKRASVVLSYRREGRGRWPHSDQRRGRTVRPLQTSPHTTKAGLTQCEGRSPARRQDQGRQHR